MDELFERFWYLFKYSVRTFYDNHKTKVLEKLAVDVDIISDKLNKIKNEESEEWLKRIVKIIDSFMFQYSEQCMQFYSDQYHINIVRCNLYRWITLKKSHNQDLNETLQLHAYIYDIICKDPVYLKDMMTPLLNTNSKIIRSRDELVEHLIICAFDYGIHGLLGKLSDNDDYQRLIVILSRYRYGVELPRNIKNGVKILKIHNTHKKNNVC